ncbi:DUF802 domain-containing protein [Novilysobacter avium]|uniref:DUF802 domain-containing protein n=1 Tax=Novilysobacter avium TaxID=2781023 RepID=A0A7S6ULW4_9GAMM|nr:DUF802 domain-containing protein [Lysobacter avium]QOW22675.1 DUF802 domain-containing protein [Lysobacter avium]
MHKNALYVVIFLVGLIAVAWIGAGYIGSNLPALAVTAVIGAFYVAGALELHRYRQATVTLMTATDDAAAALSDLSGWLQRLHHSLRNAVRLRVEGERVALPAPALTPYLVGLLVLLGMLGTLLGMMATLRGTGLALAGATDLEAIRGSLGAPVSGLAFAFGTSIAGVAASSMLGLLSALCRRERVHAVQQLDLQLASTLRPYSHAHQREETFRLLQQQTGLMPTLIERLDTLSTNLQQLQQSSGERLSASQDEFHSRTDAHHARMAANLEQSLKAGLEESARSIGAVLSPMIESTMTNLAQENAALQASVTDAVQRQLDGVSASLQTATSAAADTWQSAAAGQQRANDGLVHALQGSLEQFTAGFEQQTSTALQAVSARLDLSAERSADAWDAALSRQRELSEQLAASNQQAMASAAATYDERAAALIEAMRKAHDDSEAALQSRDQQRVAQWSDALSAVNDSLENRWRESSNEAVNRQKDICDTLGRTAAQMAAQAQAQAQETIAEVARLMQTAAEAPRVAAEVIAELRQSISDSLVRDNAMLAERNQLLATLETLLDDVNHASTEQRTSVDALVSTSADLLERVGTRFSEQIDAQTGTLGAAAAQVSGGAVEVASLAEVLGAVVEQFGSATDALGGRLEQIEAALETSLARSDEQLAYYVAQAREVIDLSMLSQKQIIGELQQLAGTPGTPAHGKTPA